MPAEPDLTALAVELSEAAQADAAAIDDILETAADAVTTILAKYNDVPGGPRGVDLRALGNARIALGNLRQHAQRQSTQLPEPFPPAP